MARAAKTLAVKLFGTIRDRCFAAWRGWYLDMKIESQAAAAAKAAKAASEAATKAAEAEASLVAERANAERALKERLALASTLASAEAEMAAEREARRAEQEATVARHAAEHMESAKQIEALQARCTQLGALEERCAQLEGVQERCAQLEGLQVRCAQLEKEVAAAKKGQARANHAAAEYRKEEQKEEPKEEPREEPKEELSRPVLAVDSSTRSAWGSSSVNERAQVSQPHAATLGSGQDMPSAGGLSTALAENAALKEENERLRGLMKTALWELAALPKPQRNSEILRALPNSKHKEIEAEGQVQLKHGSFSAR